MSDTIYELQVGYHVDKRVPYQRIICDTDFTNHYYEVNNDRQVEYSKEQPKHWIPEVEEACENIDLILEVAKLNYDADKMVATIRDNKIVTGEDIDIWNDIKVWNNGEYPKFQDNRLKYVKHSYHNKYLRSGIDEVEMQTGKLYHKGHVLHFTITSSTFQDRYTVILMGTDRLTKELTDNIHGEYHGYRYFESFEDMQSWFDEEYGVRLVKDGKTVYHRC